MEKNKDVDSQKINDGRDTAAKEVGHQRMGHEL